MLVTWSPLKGTLRNMGFLSAFIIGSDKCLVLILRATKRWGYPFSPRTSAMWESSLSRASCEQIRLALYVSVLIKLRLYLRGTKLWKCEYCPVQVGFLNTERLREPSDLLERKTSGKLNVLSLSNSDVNSIAGCALLNKLRIEETSAWELRIIKISST